MIRTVAFDVMDTLLHDPFREALQAATGVSLQELFSRRDPDAYPAFERGETDEATYWAAFTAAGVDVDPDAFHAVRRQACTWLPGMAELLDDLDGLVERATASNYPVWIEELGATRLAGRVDRVLASHHLGVRKPDLAFYRALLEALERDVDEVLFVDDREVNVEAARAAGLRAHRFEDAATLRGWLAQHGVPIAPV